MHRFTPAWDEVVRLVASMRARVVSPSLVLLRLGFLRAAEPRPPSLGRARPHPQNRSHLAHPGQRGIPPTHGPGAQQGRGLARTVPLFCASARKGHCGDGSLAISCTPSAVCRCYTTRWWLGTWCTSSPSSSSCEPRASGATMSC
jgi:hypothetical protein